MDNLVNDLLNKQIDICLTIVEMEINNKLIPFPQSVDSQIWNDRVESLLKNIQEKLKEVKK